METTISSLPDDVLQVILRKLDARDLLKTSQVSRRWQKISCCSWKPRLDLTKYHIHFKLQWRSVRRILSSNTKCLVLTCHEEPGCDPYYKPNKRRWKHDNSLTIPMVKSLREAATHLWGMALNYQHYGAIKLHFLPATLVKLDMYGSYIPKNFFADVTGQQPLPNLKGLRIDSCQFENRSDKVIQDICDRWPELDDLDMGRFSGAGKSLEIIGTRLLKLTSLDVSGVSTTQNGIRTVCRNLKDLEKFLLGCTYVNWCKLIDSLVTLPRLKRLDVQGNRSMTGDLLMRLTALTQLEHLNVVGCGIHVRDFQQAHPNGKNMTIIHQMMLSSDQWESD